MNLQEILKINFLEYSSYVIKERAIANIIDGLKPVQRRILHSLFEVNDGNFHKVANVIGNTMKYHPHGDSSIYEALVNLANKELFIEKQGNFGNLHTGDEASASRYIECKLCSLAFDVLYSPQITKYTPSYDGRNNEPLVFPAKIPVVLIQGTEGIAVGMSTKILPHNFNEVLNALKKAINEEDFTLYPDFLTGGIIDVSQYREGNGKVLVRAKIDILDEKTIVIREIPFGETTETLIASIENAIRRNYIKVSSINDFTTDKVEIELRLPRAVYAQELIEKLYLYTNCEISISLNMLVIKDEFPVNFNISDIVKFHSQYLQDVLKSELNIKKNKTEESIFYKSLEQLFIENKIYKVLEEQEREENILREVKKELFKYKDLFYREILDDDVEKLLKIPIRKISLFDINKNQKDIKNLKKELRAIIKNIKNIKDYSINYIDFLLNKYGSLYKRKTKISKIEIQNVKDIATKNLKVYVNFKTGFVGTSVDGDLIGNASVYDKILIIMKNSYQVKSIKEKIFVGQGIVSVLIYDEKTVANNIYSFIYLNKIDKLSYVKRFKIDKFMIDKEYEFLSSDCHLLDFSKELNIKVSIQTRLKINREFPIDDFIVKGYGALGKRVSQSPIISAKFINT